MKSGPLGPERTHIYVIPRLQLLYVHASTLPINAVNSLFHWNLDPASNALFNTELAEALSLKIRTKTFPDGN